MVTDVKYISLESTYRELQDLLIDYPRLKTFPLVDRQGSDASESFYQLNSTD